MNSQVLIERTTILVPRGCARFGQNQESWPLAGPNFLSMYRVQLYFVFPVNQIYQTRQVVRLPLTCCVGPAQRLRFLVCSLCGQEWHTTRTNYPKSVSFYIIQSTTCNSRKYPYLPLWKFWLSFMHFGLNKPPIPREFRSLLRVKYGYFLELKVYVTDLFLFSR